jgi:hypothetical protein
MACLLRFARKKLNLVLILLQHLKIPIACQMATFEKPKSAQLLKIRAERGAFPFVVLPGSIVEIIRECVY